mmetsp:Transcript_47558/g.126087  ORF Transcript_47558/g.126087 Transcript_47558/m.126087 type:complete len:96 (+) Transcript_47558:627-914(+)
MNNQILLMERQVDSLPPPRPSALMSLLRRASPLLAAAAAVAAVHLTERGAPARPAPGLAEEGNGQIGVSGGSWSWALAVFAAMLALVMSLMFGGE